jgi:hypothetical protein
MHGIDTARSWCGHGGFAHNLVKISGLSNAKRAGCATAPHMQLQHHYRARQPIPSDPP